MWIIVAELPYRDRKVFEMGFKSERAARLYVKAYGNSTWKVVPLAVLSEANVRTMIEHETLAIPQDRQHVMGH
jgi:hypothetical protein